MTCADCERWRDRAEELERILGLHEVPLMLPHLQPQAARLLGLLLKREFISYEMLEVALRRNNEPVSIETSKTHMCNLRKWLGKDRSLLQTRWGQGFFIAAKDKPRIRQLIEERRL